jgi:hypothetical protein
MNSCGASSGVMICFLKPRLTSVQGTKVSKPKQAAKNLMQPLMPATDRIRLVTFARDFPSIVA